MALTANALPSQPPEFAAPFDVALSLGEAQTLTATGYLDASKTVDMGGGAQMFLWSTLISALDVASSDETYRLCLFGSNDIAFGNGNVELLAFHDFAAVTAGRIISTILGASPAVPPTLRSASQIQIPCSNLMQGIVFRYSRAYLVIGGTTPSITIRSSWLSTLAFR